MKDTNLSYLPPQNLEAETAVLGAIILEGEAFKEASQVLVADDFYRESHRIIFNAMIEIHNKRLPIDIITLSNYLQEADKLKQIGGLPYLTNLANSVLTTAHVQHHAKIVKEKSQKRQLINICRKTIDSLYEDDDFSDILSQHRLQLSNITANTDSLIVSMREVSKNTLTFVERRNQNRYAVSGMKSGLKELDELTDGFQNGDYVIIGARPGMGKSAFAMSILQNAGVPAGVVSLEMSEYQIGIRSLASLSGVDLWQLRKGIIYDAQWKQIIEASGEMANLPIYFTFSARKARSIEKAILEMIDKKGVRTIVVDYLQLVRSENTNINREREIAEVSNMLKGIAVDYKIPVFAVAQLNRDLEKRENKRPILADLRESGAIEQDADLVLFLYREDYYKPNTANKGEMEIIIAKGRNTGIGKVKVFFDGDKMQFRDLNRGEV